MTDTRTLLNRLSALLDDEDAGNDEVRDAAVDVVGVKDLFEYDQFRAQVREAWDALGTAVVEKDDWRAAMQQAYEMLSEALGLFEESEGGELVCQHCGQNPGHNDVAVECYECHKPWTSEDDEKGETCHNCGADMGPWRGEPTLRCPECDAPHTMTVAEDWQ